MVRTWILFLLLGVSAQGQFRAPNDWGRLSRLRAGQHADLILVQPVSHPDQMMGEERCLFVNQTPSTLTCISSIDRSTRIVFPSNEVAMVYLVTNKSGFSKAKLIGGMVLGALIGGAITDDKFNWPLSLLGALGGAGYGLVPSRDAGQDRYRCIYVKPW